MRGIDLWPACLRNQPVAGDGDAVDCFRVLLPRFAQLPFRKIDGAREGRQHHELGERHVRFQRKSHRRIERFSPIARQTENK